MKSIHVTFEDTEFEDLKRVKGDKSWHDFIVAILEILKTFDEKKSKRR